MDPCLQGLLPLHFSRQTGLPPDGFTRESATLTVGAMADSAYEYFLKMWLLTNKTVRTSHVTHSKAQAQKPLQMLMMGQGFLVCFAVTTGRA